MRCGAACGQSLRTQRSMRMHFLLSAPSLLCMTTVIKTEQARRPSWSTPGKSERLPLAVRWPDQPPTLQPQAARVIDAQSWTALFRAFSSHHK